MQRSRKKHPISYLSKGCLTKLNMNSPLDWMKVGRSLRSSLPPINGLRYVSAAPWTFLLRISSLSSSGRSIRPNR